MSVAAIHTFEGVDAATLAAMPAEALALLPYGVTGLDRDGIVVVYSGIEARLAGLDPATVIGLSFFESVAQCMNNFMVAQRFEDEAELDEIIPYVLTFRMRPTRVRIRLLATPLQPLRYILIER